MDIAFLSAVVRADRFPAKTPGWQADSVPLYHFGHVMIGALTLFTGLRTGVTFNLGLALIGALSAVAIFGLVYNLLVGRGRPLAAVVFGMVAVGLLLVLSNMEGLFELMARHGVGNARFYELVGIDGLDGPPTARPMPAIARNGIPPPGGSGGGLPVSPPSGTGESSPSSPSCWATSTLICSRYPSC